MNSDYLSVEHQSGKLVVSVCGRWVFDNVLALEEATASVAPEPGHVVVFTCAGLEDIDLL